MNASIVQLNSDWEGMLEELPSECDDFVGELEFPQGLPSCVMSVMSGIII